MQIPKTVYLIFAVIPGFLATWITLFASLDINLADFISQALKGGVDTYRLVLIAVALLLFALFVLLSNVTIFSINPKKNWMLIIHFTISIIWFIAFALIGSEFSSPNYSFMPFTKTNNAYKYGTIFEQSGVEFKIDKCLKSGTKIICEVILLNKYSDIAFSDGSRSHIVDNRGNKAQVTKYIVGDQNYDNLYLGYVKIPVGTNAVMKISFELPNSNSKVIRALYLNLKFDGRHREIVFRNIPLS